MTHKNENSPEMIALDKLYRETFCCCQLDWEITMGGNGTNASEALNALDAVYNIFDKTPPEINDEDVEKYRKSIEENN
jgi:hypothetical protein